MRKNEGITLIALVVTIVVLLILAGTSIAMLSGENGIITQAQLAKLNSRGAEVKEGVSLSAIENESIEYMHKEEDIDKYWTGKAKMVEKLENEGKLTQEEADALLGRNGKTEIDIIKIGEIETDFSILKRKPKTEESSTVSEIVFAYTTPLDTWTNEDVVVTANANTTEYTIETSIDGQTWSSTNSQTLAVNGKVYARLMNGTSQVGDIFETEVTKIDKTAPEIGTLEISIDEMNTCEFADDKYTINAIDRLGWWSMECRYNFK